MKELCALLKPLRNLNVSLQSDEFETAGEVFTSIRETAEAIVEKSQGSDLGNQLSSILMHKFCNMFIECTNEYRLYAILAYLDPRYSSYIPENERNCLESILINNYGLFYNDPNRKCQV